MAREGLQRRAHAYREALAASSDDISTLLGEILKETEAMFASRSESLPGGEAGRFLDLAKSIKKKQLSQEAAMTELIAIAIPSWLRKVVPDDEAFSRLKSRVAEAILSDPEGRRRVVHLWNRLSELA